MHLRLLALWLGGFTVSAPQAAAGQEMAPPPLPELFAPRALRTVTIAPDGRHLAWIAPRDTTDRAANLVVADHDGAHAVAVTAAAGHGIRDYQWRADGRGIFYRADTDGDRIYRLYYHDLVNNTTRVLLAEPDVQVNIIAVSTEHPEVVLVAANRDGGGRFDAWRINARTGAITLAARNPGTFGSVVGNEETWHADQHLNVRLAIETRADGASRLHVRTAGGEWVALGGDWPLAIGEPEVVAVHDDDALLLDTRDGVARGLTRLSFASGQVTRVYTAATDIKQVLLDQTTGQPIAVAHYADRLRWTALRQDYAARLVAMTATCDDGDLSITSRSRDDRWWTAWCDRSDRPLEYLVFDEAGLVVWLRSAAPQLEDYRFRPKTSFRTSARDGQSLQGYITTPADIGGPWPTVLLVHGGPWARDEAGFDRVVQALTGAGFAVLQVNFRGSSGFTLAWSAAGIRQLGAAMQSDLIDATRWAAEQRLTDTTQLAIMGGSYGGYAALAGAALTPDRYRAAVSMAGFGNLVSLLERVGVLLTSSRDFYYEWVGHPVRDREMLAARSPFHQVERIRIPILLGHGERDPLVPVAEAREMAEALRTAGVPYQLLIFPDEGHGLVRFENRVTFYESAVAFLRCYVKEEGAFCPDTQ